jgi:integrase
MYIRPLGRGRWQCVWDHRDPVTGQRHRSTRVVHGTKREAEQIWLAEAQRRAGRPAPLATWSPQMTLGAYLAAWLAHGETQRRLRPKTIRTYDQLIRSHIGPALGPVPLERLHPAAVSQALHDWHAQDGLAPATVRQCYAILHRALEQAVLWGLLAQSPCARVAAPRLGPRPPVTVWSPEAVRRFAAVAAQHPQGTLFLVLVRTGLRLGEGLGLQWTDIDWAAPGLRVARQLLERPAPDGQRFGPVKTAHGAYRWVDLDAETVAWLRQRQAVAARERAQAGASYDDHGLVWQSRVGTPLRHRNVQRLFARLVQQAEVPPIRVHDLRHTHASFLIAAGADPALVRDRLGHHSAAFTLQIYGHLWPGRTAAVLAQLPSLEPPTSS